ncbi:unnamed protein product [Peniophora sp. CBMAI 1063]|nr:unnamed protein product [Peniophora sp. CBMAI 1063]
MAQPDHSLLDGLSDEEKKEAEKVRRWRHDIQRELLPTPEYLQRRGPLTVEIARPVDIWFKEIESYDGMTIQSLSYSKIGKVMRHVVLLDAELLPSSVDDAFGFRERARKLVDSWHSELVRSPRHRSRPSESSQAAPAPSFTAGVSPNDTSGSAQEPRLTVGGPPIESPLADRTRSERDGEDVNRQARSNTGAVEVVLDIAPPKKSLDARPIIPEEASSPPIQDTIDGAEAVCDSPDLANPDPSHETTTPPSLADVDPEAPEVQGETDEGTDNASGDDWVVIDVNVQMESVRIE